MRLWIPRSLSLHAGNLAGLCKREEKKSPHVVIFMFIRLNMIRLGGRVGGGGGRN